MKPKLNYLILALLIVIAILGMYYRFSLLKRPVTTTIVQQMRSLNRWETAAFTTEKIIDKGTQYNALKQFLFGDRLLMIAHGEVIAGFDLSKFKSEQVIIRDSAIEITLPAPQILTSRIDNEKTRVYDRQQGVLTKGTLDLESEARADAEKVLRAAACEAGILKLASENAEKQLNGMLVTLGYKNVEINAEKAVCN